MSDAIVSDASGPYLVRDPRSRLPVSVDWSAWLTQEATTIASSVWSIETGMVVDTPSATTTVASIYVSGGAAGSTYVLRNTITTASGLIDSRSIRVIVKDR